jgi:hypothetical protein
VRSIVSLDASPPYRVQKSGVRTAAQITPTTALAVCGIWENEDQELAGLGFGFRALTRTPVAFRGALLNVGVNSHLSAIDLHLASPSTGRSLAIMKNRNLIVMRLEV